MRRAILPFLVPAWMLAAAPPGDLLLARTEGDLAMFIHERVTRETPVQELLRGLGAPQTLKLPCYSAPIPVKEIYGTIVQTRFDRQLGAGFWARGFSYNVREICSFRDAQGELVRYSIFIFDDQQYREMKALLNRKAAKTTAKTGG